MENSRKVERAAEKEGTLTEAIMMQSDVTEARQWCLSCIVAAGGDRGDASRSCETVPLRMHSQSF